LTKGELTKEDAGWRVVTLRAVDATFVAFKHLGAGLGTALLALATLIGLLVTALAGLFGVGLLAVPVALRIMHGVADLERARLTRWGPEVIAPGPLPTRLRAAAADPTTRRELRWLAGHATGGLLLGLIGVVLPLSAGRDLSFPLWWRFVPKGQAGPTMALWTVWDWPGAFAVALLGLGWFAIAVGLNPVMARLQARPGRRLLPPGPDVDLPLRVAQLTATRAAALDAHATELRRIERALHDGTQNRLVAVTVLLGAARRMMDRDPAGVDALLERAQSAAEQALAELRAVGRGILPPVLVDRGLAGALTGLAANCSVPCRIEVEAAERCAASVEATVYFIVAEALTNVSRHSQARQAAVAIRSAAGRLHVAVTDDGRGGADENRGSGLTGMRHRIEAHDGTLTLTSPLGGPTTLELDVPCGS
jgi:signal transduction histidine kinase